MNTDEVRARQQRNWLRPFRYDDVGRDIRGYLRNHFDRLTLRQLMELRRREADRESLPTPAEILDEAIADRERAK